MISVHDGESALAHAEGSRVDIAVIDILMPVKEGIETIIAFKRRFPETCVIAVSGGSLIGGVDFLSMAVRLGADHALQKPVRAMALRQTIAECREARKPKD